MLKAVYIFLSDCLFKERRASQKLVSQHESSFHHENKIISLPSPNIRDINQSLKAQLEYKYSTKLESTVGVAFKAAQLGYTVSKHRMLSDHENIYCNYNLVLRSIHV